MLDSVLRVFGKDFDVDAFLKQYPLSIPAEPYSKGEPDLLGNPNIDSGFDALVSENVEIFEKNDSFFWQRTSRGRRVPKSSANEPQRCCAKNWGWIFF